MRAGKGALRILMYHRFPAREIRNLERQCAHLRRHYHPVAMREVAASLQAGRPLPRRAVAVTVDDGYRDFAESAAPIFEAYGIPATMFLVTSVLDREQWQWWDVVAYAIDRTRRKRIEWCGNVCSLTSAGDRATALDRILRHVKSLPNRERLALIEEIRVQLGVPIAGAPPADCAALSWDQVRQLQKRGFEFGGHTHTHPTLSRIESVGELRREITLCKKRIEAETGAPVIHFCYPNGNADDITAQTVEEVASAGYGSGVTAVAEINERMESPFLLRRYAIYNQMPLPHFAQVLAGMHDEPQDLRGLLPATAAAS